VVLSNSPWVFSGVCPLSFFDFSLSSPLSHSLCFLSWLCLGEACSLSTLGPLVSLFTFGFWCVPPRHTLFKCRHPTSTMYIRQNSLKALRATNSLDYIARQGQQDSEKEFFECQRMRIHLGAIHSMMTFELETLSQQIHLIERL
jgi:hypothetical protein